MDYQNAIKGRADRERTDIRNMVSGSLAGGEGL